MSRNQNQSTMDKLVSLAKRRGYIFQSSEIYGGLSSCYDYGPLGVELRRNIKETWWNDIVTSRENVVGMDSSILMHPKVWEASGHVENFTDPLVDCKQCKNRFRKDKGVHKFKCTNCRMKFHVKNGKIGGRKKYRECFDDLTASEPESYINSTCPRCGQEESIVLDKIACPKCGAADLTDPKQFNLMFKTHYGASEDSAHRIYLRPETAQGIFVNYANVANSARAKLPFGIAQIGKAFRNEVTTRNFIFRSREFEQMELEFFVRPKESQKWHEKWIEFRLEWYKKIGIKEENLQLREHGDDELAHYAKSCVDVEYKFPFGWSELEGIADRQTYDLQQHIDHSGSKLTYYDQDKEEHIVPAVVESSAGVDRTMLTVLADAYWEDDENDRVVLSLSPKLAPIKAAVFPLVNREKMPEIAKEIFHDLQGEIHVEYDDSGSIGRRYRRQDEAGTPFCITIDSQTTEDQTVTLRDRDSLEQIRVNKEALLDEIQIRIS